MASRHSISDNESSANHYSCLPGLKFNGFLVHLIRPGLVSESSIRDLCLLPGGWEPCHWFPQNGTSEDDCFVLWVWDGAAEEIVSGCCGAAELCQWVTVGPELGGRGGEEDCCLGAIKARPWGLGLPRGPGTLVVGPGEEAVQQAPCHLGVVGPKEEVWVLWGGAAPTTSTLSPMRGGSRAGGGQPQWPGRASPEMPLWRCVGPVQPLPTPAASAKTPKPPTC